MHQLWLFVSIALVIVFIARILSLTGKISAAKERKTQIKSLVHETDPSVIVIPMVRRNGDIATSLSIVIRNGPQFNISFRSNLDRFLKAFRLTHEIETGDPDFDSRYLVSTLDQKEAETVFNDANFLPLMKELLDSGNFSSFRCSPKRMILLGKNISANGVTKASLQDSVALLKKLSMLVEDRGALNFTSTGSLFRLQAFPVLSIMLGLGGQIWCVIEGFTGGPLFLHRLRFFDNPLFWPLFLPISMVIALLLSISLFFVFLYQGQQGAGLHRIYVFGLISNFIAGAYLSFALIIMVNRFFDQQNESKIIYEVRNEFIEYGKHTRYYTVARKPNASSAWYRFQVSLEDFNQIQTGAAQLEVVTKPGYLGYEWLVGYFVMKK